MWLSKCGSQHNRGVTDFFLSDGFKSRPNRSHIPRLYFCRYHGEEEPGKPEAGREPLLAACLLWREALSPKLLSSRRLSPHRALVPLLSIAQCWLLVFEWRGSMAELVANGRQV